MNWVKKVRTTSRALVRKGCPLSKLFILYLNYNVDLIDLIGKMEVLQQMLVVIYITSDENISFCWEGYPLNNYSCTASYSYSTFYLMHLQNNKFLKGNKNLNEILINI